MGEQRHIGCRELAREAGPGCPVALLEGFARKHLAHQAVQLNPKVGARAPQIVHHYPLVWPGKPPIAQTAHHWTDVGVTLGFLALRLKMHHFCPVEKGAGLRHRIELLFVHVDRHWGAMIDPSSRFILLCRWKRLALPSPVVLCFTVRCRGHSEDYCASVGHIQHSKFRSGFGGATCPCARISRGSWC